MRPGGRCRSILRRRDDADAGSALWTPARAATRMGACGRRDGQAIAGARGRAAA